ncbi:ABC transporter ATP-binding protein [Propionivibrio dicarboxylicus]|uniref:Amino acid/amide ABC transporter ATP-binding protein 1, HAAT family n=1 Tax=Propionivibrio dicarboxylicus TaxID=83767 RepID=A0A1G8J671_9RHOO|nr:ABC transporter ATP-binding protein [Propionivibrio dicarboxylicus]SDI26130.1 amino acid/amide ABC transporter ATP-binding protein 1, HAAT family [Propionivibrio dicarboxylicus]
MNAITTTSCGLLEVSSLSKSFGGVRAVCDFSFNAQPGEIVGIIGPNGAGKTTAFNLVTGVYAPDKGSVKLDGVELSGLRQDVIARAGIGRTFQNIRLFKGLTVLENVMTASDPYAPYGFFSAILALPGKRKADREAADKAREYLNMVGLGGMEDARPESLPYGLQRKLELARALAIRPKVILLDEPAAGLNPSEVRDFIELVRRLHERFNFTIVFIEHRMEVVMNLSHKLFVLSFGKLLASGDPETVRRNPEVIEAYIGEEE